MFRVQTQKTTLRTTQPTLDALNAKATAAGVCGEAVSQIKTFNYLTSKDQILCFCLFIVLFCSQGGIFGRVLNRSTRKARRMHLH
jgi:hypothetical protein